MLMTCLESIIENLCKAGMSGELWVDGSFLTEKIDPDDIDLGRWTPFFGPKRGLYLLGEYKPGPARLGGEAGRAPQFTQLASSL